jgi:AcrR family transcriptional regulator
MNESSGPALGGLRSRGPSPAKTAQTRRTITAAALDAFLERGFSGTRMSDVAGRAGIAKGTLYLYFADKEALFEGVLREVIAEPLSGLGGGAPRPGESARAFLSRVVGPILRDMERSRRAAVIRLVVSEGARFPVLAETYRRVVIDPAAAAIRQLARRAMETGELRTDALVRFPQLLAAPGVLVTLWNGLFAEDGGRLDGEAVFEAYLDMVFGAGGR